MGFWGSNTIHIIRSIRTLKPYYLGPWTLRVRDAFCQAAVELGCVQESGPKPAILSEYTSVASSIAKQPEAPLSAKREVFMAFLVRKVHPHNHTHVFTIDSFLSSS